MAQLKQKVTLKRKKELVTPPPKSKSKKWLWLLLLPFVIAAVVISRPKNHPTEVNSIVAPVEKSDIEETEQIVTTEQTPIEESVKDEVNSAKNPATVTSAEEPSTQSEKVGSPDKNTSKAPTQSDQSVSINKPTSISSQGSLEEKAKQVIRGDFGNGAERKNALGSDYQAIQRTVNKMYRTGKIY